jgi:glycosyltransferase involved in cell wall biosynthesis
VEDVAGFLAGVDVVAVPSRWEAYGMVANEAREAGRPVLVAPVDGLPEQVMGGGGLVVDLPTMARCALRWRRWTARLAAMAAAGALPPGDCAGQRARAWAGLLADLLGRARARPDRQRPALRNAACHQNK